MRRKVRVTVFGFDAAESAQIRRIRSLMDCGYAVAAFTMRRRNMNAGFTPFWRNVHLFEVANERLGRRVIALVLSLLKIARHIGLVRQADVLVARNLDLLLLAQAARLMALRPRLPLIYECLDVHGAFTDASWKGAAFRRVERLLLRRIDLLVVSSPGFVRNYFAPVQDYDGPVYLLENKIWFGGAAPARRTGAVNLSRGAPFVLAWAGSLRCEPSLRILLETARRLPDRVRLALHGNVHAHAVPHFHERVAALANVTYHGPYRYPDGLAAVYGGCDLVWSQDLWQSGANSHWLMPNRIYEASYFGCLSVAVAGTQTAQTVAERGLGYVIAQASADALVDLLARLDRAEVDARRAALLARPAQDFVQSRADVRAMVETALARGRRSGAAAARARASEGA